MGVSKTRTSFYRRLYLAWLINRGINNVPAIQAATGMPRRTAQDTLNAIHELDIACVFEGANKNGGYEIADWGPINPAWLEANAGRLAEVLEYPFPPTPTA
ncbi:winged helix-turn-helix domain-containing protein [Simiduia agarivorans]|uniref:Helix-turn-helix type 11 domain-containing protein n=1 Tax=Simiduia agarivorans (strain DSM 21679 / JCM 13881 / BCRC 17597 / SA1) TaxID=1117647 RepID=K4KN56_SIMAS|nr:winged helix-turn-helix domain-containing protein [Simiduia agarivorans]AFU99548.1 hypothetical protein M5M_11855 [Simiduia agarivorans SA1 = DSM 21679]